LFSTDCRLAFFKPFSKNGVPQFFFAIRNEVTMKTESEKRKLQMFMSTLAVIALAINAHFVLMGRGTDQPPQPRVIYGMPPQDDVPNANVHYTYIGTNSTTQQNSDSYTTNYVVERGQVTHIDIPLRYHLGCSWGYAPLDVRADAHPDWITHDEIMANNEHVEFRFMQWEEFRISANSDTDDVVINCTFTKLPPP
jgi:hypothetical protein